HLAPSSSAARSVSVRAFSGGGPDAQPQLVLPAGRFQVVVADVVAHGRVDLTDARPLRGDRLAPVFLTADESVDVETDGGLVRRAAPQILLDAEADRERVARDFRARPAVGLKLYLVRLLDEAVVGRAA